MTVPVPPGFMKHHSLHSEEVKEKDCCSDDGDDGGGGGGYGDSFMNREMLSVRVGFGVVIVGL